MTDSRYGHESSYHTSNFQKQTGCEWEEKIVRHAEKPPNATNQPIWSHFYRKSIFQYDRGYPLHVSGSLIQI